MKTPHLCPECGAGLPADAPGGLCPRCLLGAAIAEAQSTRTDESEGGGNERESLFGPWFAESEAARTATPVDLDQFKRAVQELGLIRAEELERCVPGVGGGVPELAKALVRAGKLTRYQAGALSQGKARELVIGNYFILDELGAGGMGVVFKARHRRLGRVVALKILPPSLARDTNLFLRFRREVDVAARLSHPNIVSVLDADEDRGVQFMTMEYIEGNDLDNLVRDSGVLSVDQALDCVIQAARGLEAAHAQGVVHRDVKPGNLMLDGSGQVRVLDLGLARLVEASNPFGETAPGPLTKSESYIGTVDFMAPEQGIDPRRVEHRADIYSLGCTLCYLLTGRAPFEGATVLARLVAHQERAPLSLLAVRPDVPKAIDAAYQKMMAKQPADRPASMSEVIELLDGCRSSAGRADEARSGMRTFAESVTMNRASPTVTVGESVFRRDEPAGVPLGSDRKLEDPDQERPAAPVVRTLVEEPALIPNRTGSAWPLKRVSPKSLAFALGALALLATGGLGYSLISRGAGKSAADRGLVSDSDRSSSIQRFPESSSTESLSPQDAPRSSSTFDVATLYSTYGHDGHAGSVESIAVTNDGRRALIGSWTEYSEVIDVDAGTRVVRLDWLGATPTVAMTPDGHRGLIGTRTVKKDNLKRIKAKEAGILWFWDLTTSDKLFPKQQPYDGPVTSVAIARDGLRGLSASREGELTLWDLTTGQPLRSLGPQQGAVSPHAMAFFADGRRAATAGNDKLVHLWDLDTGRALAAWKGHDNTISGLAISPNGRRIVTGSLDATVILWDVDRGAIFHRFEMPPDDTGARVTFDGNGNIVAAGNGMRAPDSELLDNFQDDGNLETADDGNEGSPPKPGNLIVWDADTPYGVLRRDERPFARHLAVAALPGGRVLTGDRYALRLWTPRQPGAGASEPPAPTNRGKSPVNLLALIQPPTFKIGDWQMRRGALLSPPTSGARLQVPYAPPPEYRIDMEVELIDKDGDYGFALGLVIGGRQTEITIDKKVERHGKCTGLDGFDGVPVHAGPSVHRGQLLFPSRSTRLSVTVRRNSINLTCDGSIVVDWSGDPKRLIRIRQWHIPDPKALFLASSSSILFHEMTLTPLTAASP
jgi:eukaryotic-like serine/threonine-protein kinase